MPETNPEPGVTIAMESANASVQDLFTIQDELCDRTLQLLQLSLEERERRAIHFSAPWTVCPLRFKDGAFQRDVNMHLHGVDYKSRRVLIAGQNWTFVPQ